MPTNRYIRAFNEGGEDVSVYYRPMSAPSSYGRPVAIVFGTQRVPGQFIYYGQYFNDMAAYTASGTVVQTGLCEGPISQVLYAWREKTRATPASLSMTIAVGDITADERYGFLVSNDPEFALSYGGLAKASITSGHGENALGGLDRTSFEVEALWAVDADPVTGALDADPAEVIANLLCNDVYGLGWDIATLADGTTASPGGEYTAFQVGPDGSEFSGYRYFTGLIKFAISMAITEQRPARDIVQEVLTATDSVAVWSEGKLKVFPQYEEIIPDIGDDFTPYLTPRYDLGASSPGSDFIVDGPDDPIRFERLPNEDVYNTWPIEWSNREPSRKDTTGATISEPFNAYNSWVDDGVPDPTDVENNGMRKADPTSLRCITRAAHAAKISELLARRALHTSRVKYQFRLGWRFALLEPFDIVTLTDSVLGLDRRPVRITEIEEQEDGTFEVVAYEIGTISVAATAAYTVT